MGRPAALLFLLALGLAACGSTTQAVTGVLVDEGGPSPGVHAPVSGDIKLSGPLGTYSTTAGRNGRFSVDAPPGKYHILGRPAYMRISVYPGKPAVYPCGGQQVIVKTGINTQTTVACVNP